MPNWITIAALDLNDHKVGELVEALRTEALAQGQGDPMPGIITQVVSEIRGAIGFSGRYVLDADLATVPKSLREAAAKKIIRVLKGRLEIALSEDERTDAKVYEARLQSLVSGEWPVETADIPLNPVPTQQAASVPAITSRIRKFSSEAGDGS